MFLKQYMVTQQGVVGVILSVTACLKTNTDFSRSLSLSLCLSLSLSLYFCDGT